MNNNLLRTSTERMTTAQRESFVRECADVKLNNAVNIIDLS